QCDRTDPADRAGFNACGAPLPGDRGGHAGSARAGGPDAGRLTTGGGFHHDATQRQRDYRRAEPTFRRADGGEAHRPVHAKGGTLFVLVDHSGEAAKIGMTMPPTKLLILGNPKAGTPLMLAAPSVAIALPLKILVWVVAECLGGNAQLAGDGRGVAAFGEELQDAALLLGERLDRCVMGLVVGERNELSRDLEHAVGPLLVAPALVDVALQPHEEPASRTLVVEDDC